MRAPVDFYDLIIIAGLAAIVYGLYLIWAPLGFIGAGAGLAFLGLAGAARQGRELAERGYMKEIDERGNK